ncbi:hypothetical protein [Halosolutus gelatinilyticus]|uniref:hypothetical protein n=1 Tax=Halosolutus gelatinilyticus TaxID=2931975 RepID=UPI001FF36BE9|nr:hypothetical protein [Halosolutus gelatinilyticus]
MPDDGDEFVDNLLEWYAENGRHDLPWRDPSTSPFEIFVAELMLQQTSAEQVRGVYDEFVEQYPTAGTVLAAPEVDIAKSIEPLGLRKRTEYFRRASAQLLARHDGRVPASRSELLDLHGVGEYTAASVLAHAHGRDVSAVDTNVARVLARVFGNESTEPESPEMWDLSDRLAPSGRCDDFLHALIDFGAAVCTARNPNCESCPFEAACEYETERSTDE